jgi:hypothetical protein
LSFAQTHASPLSIKTVLDLGLLIMLLIMGINLERATRPTSKPAEKPPLKEKEVAKEPSDLSTTSGREHTLSPRDHTLAWSQQGTPTTMVDNGVSQSVPVTPLEVVSLEETESPAP